MKNLPIYILLILNFGCSTEPIKDTSKSCIKNLDSIARVNTFREAIGPAETCAKENEQSTKLQLTLAEYYLLSHLVDEEESGLEKSILQFGVALKIDSTFESNYMDFNLKPDRNDKFQSVVV